VGALLALSGCAQVQALFAPAGRPAAAPPAVTAPPPASGPAAPAPPPPPPAPAPPAAPAAAAPGPPTAILTPQLSTDQERRLRDDAQRKLDETARLLRQLEGRPLRPRDRETLALAQGLLDPGRKALVAQEYERAVNLAAKARTLADDLAAGR
jgi:hypothetical protein